MGSHQRASFAKLVLPCLLALRHQFSLLAVYYLPSFVNLPPYLIISFTVLKVFLKIFSRLLLLEFLFDLVCDRAVYLEDDRDQDVHLDQNYDDPNGYEE